MDKMYWWCLIISLYFDLWVNITQNIIHFFSWNERYNANFTSMFISNLNFFLFAVIRLCYRIYKIFIPTCTKPQSLYWFPVRLFVVRTSHIIKGYRLDQDVCDQSLDWTLKIWIWYHQYISQPESRLDWYLYHIIVLLRFSFITPFSSSMMPHSWDPFN